MSTSIAERPATGHTQSVLKTRPTTYVIWTFASNFQCQLAGSNFWQYLHLQITWSLKVTSNRGCNQLGVMVVSKQILFSHTCLFRYGRWGAQLLNAQVTSSSTSKSTSRSGAKLPCVAKYFMHLFATTFPREVSATMGAGHAPLCQAWWTPKSFSWFELGSRITSPLWKATFDPCDWTHLILFFGGSQKLGSRLQIANLCLVTSGLLVGDFP